MVSEHTQRRIDLLLAEADQAATAGQWSDIAEKARAVLAIVDENLDAQAFRKMAEAKWRGQSV